MNIVWVSIIILLLNIPFGYWRAGVKKFSLYWFLSIHIPVPIIIFLRYYSGVGFALYTYAVFIVVFFTGQKLGEYLYKNRNLLLSKISN